MTIMNELASFLCDAPDLDRDNLGAHHLFRFRAAVQHRSLLALCRLRCKLIHLGGTLLGHSKVPGLQAPPTGLADTKVGRLGVQAAGSPEATHSRCERRWPLTHPRPGQRFLDRHPRTKVMLVFSARGYSATSALADSVGGAGAASLSVTVEGFLPVTEGGRA